MRTPSRNYGCPLYKMRSPPDPKFDLSLDLNHDCHRDCYCASRLEQMYGSEL